MKKSKTAYRVEMTDRGRVDVFHLRPTGSSPDVLRAALARTYPGATFALTPEPDMTTQDVKAANAAYLNS